jgi:hypothetical protein
VSGDHEPLPDRSPPLVGLPRPPECWPGHASARIGWTLPSCPCPLGDGLQGLRTPGSRENREESPGCLSWAWAPLQSTPNAEPPLERPDGERGRSRAGAWSPGKPDAKSGTSLEVLPPTAYPRTGQRPSWPGLPHPTACAFRFSQPPDALFRPEPAGLVSCQIRSWGSPFRAFLLPRSRMPFPAPMPSWRWVRPRCPTSEARRSRSYLGYAPASYTGHVVGPSRALPAFRALLHARVRHLTKRFRPRQARSSPGPFSPPGCSPSLDWPGSHRASPHGVGRDDRKRTKRRPSRVSPPARLACPSRGCRPSWGLHAFCCHSRSRRPRFGSLLLRTRGTSPPPDSHL